MTELNTIKDFIDRAETETDELSDDICQLLNEKEFPIAIQALVDCAIAVIDGLPMDDKHLALVAIQASMDDYRLECIEAENSTKH